jgi:hypothetical protein
MSFALLASRRDQYVDMILKEKNLTHPRTWEQRALSNLYSCRALEYYQSRQIGTLIEILPKAARKVSV